MCRIVFRLNTNEDEADMIVSGPKNLSLNNANPQFVVANLLLNLS